MKRYIVGILGLATIVYAYSYSIHMNLILRLETRILGEIVAARSWQDLPNSLPQYEFASCYWDAKKLRCFGDFVLDEILEENYTGRDGVVFNRERLIAGRISPDFIADLHWALLLQDLPFLFFTSLCILGIITWHNGCRDRFLQRIEKREMAMQKKMEEYQRNLRSRTELLQIFLWIASHQIRNWAKLVSMYRTDSAIAPILFLKYFQIETRKLEFSVERVVILANLTSVESVKILFDLEQLLREVWGQRSGILSVHPLPSLYGDRDQIFLFFEQLFNNSCSYCDRVPYVSVVLLDSSPRFLLISIRDNGIGIPIDALSKIGEVGVRPHTFSGSGFGLAIAKRILELHGGSWNVESSESGTQFKVLFPKID